MALFQLCHGETEQVIFFKADDSKHCKAMVDEDSHLSRYYSNPEDIDLILWEDLEVKEIDESHLRAVQLKHPQLGRMQSLFDYLKNQENGYVSIPE